MTKIVHHSEVSSLRGEKSPISKHSLKNLNLTQSENLKDRMASDALNMKQEVISLCSQVARFGFRFENVKSSFSNLLS